MQQETLTDKKRTSNRFWVTNYIIINNQEQNKESNTTGKCHIQKRQAWLDLKQLERKNLVTVKSGKDRTHLQVMISSCNGFKL